MAKTESGWTKPLPTADGDYFSRVDEYDKWPTLIRIEDNKTRYIGLFTTAIEAAKACDEAARRVVVSRHLILIFGAPLVGLLLLWWASTYGVE